MEKSKKYWPYLVGAGVVGVAAYLYYRSRGSTTAGGDVRDYEAQMKSIIEQQDDYQELKMYEWIQQFINKNILEIDPNNSLSQKDEQQLKRMKTTYGELSREDFALLQKLISINVTVLSYEQRLLNQQSRVSLLKQQNYKGYLEQTFIEFKKEISMYLQGEKEVLELAKVNNQVYSASYEKYSNDKDGLLDFLNLCFMTPFKPKVIVAKEEVKSLLMEVIQETIALVKKDEFLQNINEKDDILVVYELLIMDLVYLKRDFHIEEFRALVATHELVKDAAVQKLIQEACDTLFDINSRY